MKELVGEAAPPAAYATLIDALRTRAREDRPWLVFHDGGGARPLTFADADRLARGYARALAGSGVTKGQRVAVLLPNGPEFVGAFFGALSLGAAAVPLAWPATPGAEARAPAELGQLIAAADPSAIVTTPALVSSFTVPAVSAPDFGPGAVDRSEPGLPAFVQLTSGSTSAPKGAVISHAAAVASAQIMALALELDRTDVGVSWLPFFHDMGLVGVLLCSLVAGFRVHILRPVDFLMRPRRWLELVGSVGATITPAPNFAYAHATKRVRDAAGLRLQSLRHALNGSEPVHRETMREFSARFGPAGFAARTFTPVYGLAEYTLGVAFECGAADDLVRGGRRVPSMGTPLAGTTIMIREDDEGEILVRGPAAMRGYLGDDGAALRDGWLHTGDLGVIDGGRLYVTGRQKELVIKAGRKFHPYEIERVVAAAVDTTPNGVAAFATLGTHSEELVIVVETKAAADERVIRGRVVDALGVRVDRVEVVPVGTLPRTTSGKVRRGECAERFRRPS